MPLVEKVMLQKTTIWFWKITESLDFLKAVPLCEESKKRLSKRKSIPHQKSFLAVRHLLKKIGYCDEKLKYYPNGKPYFEDGTLVSITHSDDFVAVAVGRTNINTLGVDIERVQERIKKMAHRFLNPRNKKITDIKLQTAIWCAKEAMYKASPFENILFSKMFVEIPLKKLPQKSRGFIMATEQINFELFFGMIDEMVWSVALN